MSVVGGACAPGDAAVGQDLGQLAGLGPLGVVATSDLASSLLGADVVIDFSTATAVAKLAKLAAKAGVGIVSGTTNLESAAVDALDAAAQQVPVLWAANMSLGVQVLAELVKQAVSRLGPGFDVEIVELHHRRKIDSPSGTARRLAEAAQEARRELRQRTAREGNVGTRSDEEMGVLGVRGGDVIGDHTVHLLGLGERLELSHRATNRELFARGAIKAALFTHRKPAGRYTMADVLE